MRARGGVAECGDDVEHRPSREVSRGRAAGAGTDGEALLDVIAMPLQMLGGEPFQQVRDRRRRWLPATARISAIDRRLVARPGVEGGDQRRLVDHAVLQGEQAEEEVAVGRHGHGHAPGLCILAGMFDDSHGTLARDIAS